MDDFRGLSRFTTWAYKFVIFETANKVARHAWRHHPPSAEDLERVPDALARRAAGEDPSERFPATAIDLRVCPGGRADHDGLLEAARRLGDLDPE